MVWGFSKVKHFQRCLHWWRDGLSRRWYKKCAIVNRKQLRAVARIICFSARRVKLVQFPTTNLRSNQWWRLKKGMRGMQNVCLRRYQTELNSKMFCLATIYSWIDLLWTPRWMVNGNFWKGGLGVPMCSRQRTKISAVLCYMLGSRI